MSINHNRKDLHTTSVRVKNIQFGGQPLKTPQENVWVVLTTTT